MQTVAPAFVPAELITPAPASAQVTTATDAEVLHVLGSTMTFGFKNPEVGEGCTQFVAIAPPGVGVPMHVHDHEDELFLVLEGTVRVELAGQPPLLATAGTSVFGPRGVAHSWFAVGDVPARLLVTVLPGGLERMFRELAALPPGPPDLTQLGAVCAQYGIRFV